MSKKKKTSEQAETGNATLGVVMPSFSDWSKQLSTQMKRHHLVKNKWKESRFRKMYNDGLSVSEAFRCWFCSH